MKTLATICLAAICLTGCSGYRGTHTPLQPGDLIIFKGPDGNARANEFRRVSLNDPERLGSVVEVTRPTTIVNE